MSRMQLDIVTSQVDNRLIVIGCCCSSSFVCASQSSTCILFEIDKSCQFHKKQNYLLNRSSNVSLSSESELPTT